MTHKRFHPAQFKTNDFQNVKVPNATKYKGRVDLLPSHPMWQEIFPQQREWVLKMLELGDGFEAAKLVYNTHDDNFARSYDVRNRRNWKINRILADYEGVRPSTPKLTKRGLVQLLTMRLTAEAETMPTRTMAMLADSIMELQGWKVRKPMPPKKQKNTKLTTGRGRPRADAPEADIFSRLQDLENEPDEVEENEEE